MESIIVIGVPLLVLVIAMIALRISPFRLFRVARQELSKEPKGLDDHAARLAAEIQQGKTHYS